VRIAWNAGVLQRFIDRRSHLRWSAHWFLAWGCIMAAAVTFPLSFGWIRFESAIGNQDIYRAFVFGIPLGSFHLGTPIAEITFNILDIAAMMVLIGVFFAFWRRGRDHGAWSVQQFSNDMLPLILLFAISITGLFLTISTHLMRGIYSNVRLNWALTFTSRKALVDRRLFVIAVGRLLRAACMSRI
jgi:hypothetical protein